MASIVQNFDQVRQRMPWWVLGQMAERSATDVIEDGLNAYPQQTHQVTIAVADVADNLPVAVTVSNLDGSNPVTVTFDSGVGNGQQQIGDGLAGAFNFEPLARARVEASYAAGVLTLTGLQPGYRFLATVGANGLSAVTVVRTAGNGAAVPFARAVVMLGKKDTSPLYALLSADAFTAFQVQTVTTTYQAGAKVTLRIYEVRSGEKVLIADATETSATNLATTLAALLVSLNAQLPNPSVNATGGVTNIVLTSEVKGLEFVSEWSVDDSGPALPVTSVVNTTPASLATSLSRAFRGVSIRYEGIGAETIGGSEQRYPGETMVSACRRGPVVVASPAGVNIGDTVYVELAPGDLAGTFSNVPSATRVALSRSIAQWGETAPNGGLSRLDLTAA